MRLQLEVESDRPAIPADGGAALIAFMSFALSRGFGAQHPLIALADRLHDQFHIALGPLTTFYDAEPDDAEDERKLEQAWQEPRPLRESLSRLACALESDAQCQALLKRAGACSLLAEAASLLPALEAAEAGRRRVRLVYTL